MSANVTYKALPSVDPPPDVTPIQMQAYLDRMAVWVKFQKHRMQMQYELENTAKSYGITTPMPQAGSDLNWKQILSGAAAGWGVRSGL
jgi:hypothetical protein